MVVRKERGVKTTPRVKYPRETKKTDQSTKIKLPQLYGLKILRVVKTLISVKSIPTTWTRKLVIIALPLSKMTTKIVILLLLN